MGYSAWKIWLRPRVTASVMEELERSVESVQGELAQARDAVRQAEASKEAELAHAREERDDISKRLRDALREVERLRGELREQAETDRRISDIESQLEKVGEMKERYEQRIARLRDELIRMKADKARSSLEADELKEIDMWGEVPLRRDDSTPKRAEGEWLDFME